MSNRLRIGAVVCGAIICSTLVIRAADEIVPNADSLGALVSGSDSSVCPNDMAPVQVSGKTICYDKFEASAHEDCRHPSPTSAIDSQRNISLNDCTPVSEEGGEPWRYINQTQAAQACALVNKRLPTNAEWYRAALGTPDSEKCFLTEREVQNNQATDCISQAGVYHLIGNTWEWTDEMVENGQYHGRLIPEAGYVSEVDADGVALSSSSTPSELYNQDYLWSDSEGVFGMIRGGFWGSETDGGLFALNGSVAPSFASNGVGFRCVKDL